MRIEVLSFDGCPNRDIALERLRAALAAERMTAELTEILVTDPVAAKSLRFLGSPTIRVNGIDVEVSARALDQFGFVCRTYRNEFGAEGAPSIETIRAALRGSSGD
jgi:hypothetical protein